MMNSKHTPTPWSVYAWNESQGEIHISAPGTPRIADLPLRFVSINEQKANAEHIVRCVNQRDNLIEALQSGIAMLTTWMHDEKQREDMVVEVERLSDILDAALHR